VGSQPHDPHDPHFIETRTFRFRQDAALLLCSDGLSDVLTSGEISEIVERYDGDPNNVARQLVDAANLAGGKDNISVVFVAGSDFLGSDSNTLVEVRPRHAETRMRPSASRWRAVLRNVLLLIAGMVLGILLWIVVERVTARSSASPARATHPADQPARGWRPAPK
jgi:hypothetical protein